MAFDVTEGGKVLGLCTWLKYLAGPERDLGTNGLLANQIAEISHGRIHFPFIFYFFGKPVPLYKTSLKSSIISFAFLPKRV